VDIEPSKHGEVSSLVMEGYASSFDKISMLKVGCSVLPIFEAAQLFFFTDV